MTMTEFNQVFSILKGECFVPAEDMPIWVEALADLKAETVMRNIDQYRQARKVGVRIVPVPMEVRVECLNWNGYDRWTYEAIQAVKKETEDWGCDE